MPELIKISDSTDALSGQAMDIYLHSFPANERQTVETIQSRVDKGLYRLYTACENDTVLAMLLLYSLIDSEFTVIDYLAVNGRHRKRGLGAWLLREVMQLAQNDGKYVVLEAEDPAYGNNKEERAARVAFYKRLRARTLENVQYLLPPLAGDKPTEMILMLMPGYAGNELQGAMVKNLVTEMYRQLYNRKGDDALLQSVIASVPESVALM